MATKGDISDLDVLKFGGKNMIPVVSGFSRVRVSGIVQSDVSGGTTVQRKKYYNMPYVCGASFYLDDEFMQDFIKTFFSRNEGKYFICYMKADRPIIEPYVVQVISEWEDSYVSAVDGSLTVTLEVVSVRDLDLDDFLYNVYSEVGSDLYNWLLGYKSIVNAIPVGD